MDNAKAQAKATAEIIEEEYNNGRSIADIMAEMSLGDVRFETSLNLNGKSFPFEYSSARIMVTFGGPTTWVQSNGEVVSYWGGEEGRWGLSLDLVDELNNYCEEMYNIAKETAIENARTNRYME